MPRKRKEDLEREIAEGKINKPHQRYAANARERSRMRVLSKAFSRLKTTLPWVPPDTKLSKLDTLRLASSYIAHLKQILDHEETMHSQGTFIHPLNLTWPFTFSSRTFGSSPPSPSNKCNDDNNKTTATSSNNTNNCNNNDNNNNNVNNNNVSNNNNNNNRTNMSSKPIVSGSNPNVSANSLHASHFGILDTYCNGALSPISDTSSLNEHEMVSH